MEDIKKGDCVRYQKVYKPDEVRGTFPAIGHVQSIDGQRVRIAPTDGGRELTRHLKEVEKV